MELYLLGCDAPTRGGGIGRYELSENGKLKRTAFFPCDRPMYAVKSGSDVIALLRQTNGDHGSVIRLNKDLSSCEDMGSTKGVCPCHLCLDGEQVVVVNYLSGNVVKADTVVTRTGKSVHATRQTEPHTHFVGRLPDGNLAVTDLGTDSLAVYDGTLNQISETKVKAGRGIRHLAFPTDGRLLYAVNELQPSVSVFSYENGKCKLLSDYPIACREPLASGAAIRLDERTQKLYVSLRVENVVVTFDCLGATLKEVDRTDCGGDGPRDFNLFGNHLVCCNEKSGTVAVFAMREGLIQAITDVVELPSALCCI